MTKIKKLVFVTGTRADFGKISVLLEALKREHFSISIFITGMHMLKEYGLTKTEVIRFCIDKEYNFVEFINQNRNDSLDRILTKTISALSDYFSEEMPDMVIYHGDRVESLAAALVSSTNYILSCHIEGGEISGTIDDIFRHSITKLSDFHLTCSKEAFARVLQLGEKRSSTYLLGSPELDFHNKDSEVSIDEVRQRYSIPFNEYGIAILHPVTTESLKYKKYSHVFFNALIKTNRNFVVIKPNNDLGSSYIKKEIVKLPKDKFVVIPSMRFSFFSELMKNTSLFIGNSSVGVREAPFLGIPSINIGTRQNNRANCDSIYTLHEFDENEIVSAVSRLWNKEFKSSQLFWNGGAAKLFSSFLKNKENWKVKKQKIFQDSKVS